MTLTRDQAKTRTGGVTVLSLIYCSRPLRSSIPRSINFLHFNSASLAAALGCGGNNPAACLRDRTHQEIVDLQDQVVSFDHDLF